MPDVGGPRPLRSDEFDEMMTLLDRSFSFEREGMAARLPFVYDPTSPERHAVITVDGEIVSHAACVPEPLILGPDTRLQCRGIGGVATAKPHRGNGYMTMLLEYWLEQLDEAGTPVCELGGDRTRYGRFDWELAAPEIVYTLTERSMTVAPAGGTVRRYTGDDADLAALRRLHDRRAPRVERDAETARAIYAQRGMETLLHCRDGQVTAYLCLSRERRSRTVQEFGGEGDGLESLLAHCLAWWDLSKLTVYAPRRHPCNEWLAEQASTWKVQPSRMLNVRDLPGSLTAYAAPLERKWQDHPTGGQGTLTLGIEGVESSAEIRWGPEMLSIDRVGDSPAVALDRQAATRLLFGGPEQMQSIKARYPVLDALFPLDWYVWQSERV